MKKLFSILSMILVFAMLFSMTAFAEGNTDTIEQWNIEFSVPSGKTSLYNTKEAVYYIYGQKTGYIPYVLSTMYNEGFDSFDDFFNAFTDYMKACYSDLEVVEKPTVKMIGDKLCCKFEYAYTISGYQARDTRIAILVPDKTYMFGSKEIEELDLTVGTMLEDVVANCTIYDDNHNVVSWEAETKGEVFVVEAVPEEEAQTNEAQAEVVQEEIKNDDAKNEPAPEEETKPDKKIQDESNPEEEIKSDEEWNEPVPVEESVIEIHTSICQDPDCYCAEENVPCGKDDCDCENNEATNVEENWQYEDYVENFIYLNSATNGMPRYWLDLTGIISMDPVLHCYFKDENGDYQEHYYILDNATSELIDNKRIAFNKIFDETGRNCSGQFKKIFLEENEDGTVTLSVVRNQKTLKDLSAETLLTGIYRMKPVGCSVAFKCYDDNGDLIFWFPLLRNSDSLLVHKVIDGKEVAIYEFDLETAEWLSDTEIVINKVYNKFGRDVKAKIGDITIKNEDEHLEITINYPDESGIKYIPEGTYSFDPSISFAAKDEGPYTEEELCVLAQWHYMRHNNVFLYHKEIEANDDGTFTIHLSNMNETKNVWYSVDSYGLGTNIKTDEYVNLNM